MVSQQLLSIVSAAAFVGAVVVAAQQGGDGDGEGGAAGKPAFFIQDPADQLCLAGDSFKRCSLDALWYVSGEPGSFEIHKRPASGKDEEKGDDGTCLVKKNCNEFTKVEDARLGKCSHCGAKKWNILGDSNQGYVLTTGNDDAVQDGDDIKKVCLLRPKKTQKATLAPCDLDVPAAVPSDLQYTPLLLQFVSAADVAAMSSPGAKLVQAASDGDKKLVQQLLSEGDGEGGKVDVNAKDWDQIAAITPAASSGNLDLVKFLVKEGADYNVADKDGITPFMEAAAMGHVKVLEYLYSLQESDDSINSEEFVEIKSNSGVTALWLAASQGEVDCMKFLIKKGADVNVARNDGISAVMTASLNGYADAVKVLIDAGAKILGRDADGVTPLMNAAESGELEVVKVLVEKLKSMEGGTANLDAVSTTGYTALIIAAAQGRTSVVEYLLQSGADPNLASGDSKVSALMYAASSNHVDAMKAIMASDKVDIEARHSNMGTALLEAATSGAGEAVRALVDAGAEVDVKDRDGVTPLMAVASNADRDAQRAVLAKVQEKYQGQELTDYLNLFSFSGGSAVMFAAASGQVEFAKELIALGAITHKVAKAKQEYIDRIQQALEEGTFQGEEPHVDGLTSLHVASQGGHTEMVKLLLEQEGTMVNHKDDLGRTPLVLAVKGNYGEIATILVENGADPDTPYTDEKGKTHNLLFDSIMVENAKFAKALIANGADIYYKDEKGVSTLLQACHRGFADIAAALIERHKSSGNKSTYLDDASEEGIRPLIAAASEGHVDVVKLLIESGADINAKDQDETTALMAAAARGHVNVVKLMLDAGAKLDEQNRDGHTALMFAYNGKNQVETLWERFVQFEKSGADDSGKKRDDGGTGPIIREALDNHTALVDMLLKSGADTKLKDKEGHTAKDFDYHPDTDAELLEKEAKKEALRDESKEEL